MPVASLLLLAAAQVHDPVVLRCAFEDRSRMVLFNPSPQLWMAFNPVSCTLEKVWEGEVDWRGKVFDFSQNNSQAKGRVIYEAPSILVRLEDGKPGAWSLKDVQWKDGWNMTANSVIESPLFSTADFTRLCVMFDETSRKGPVRAEIVAENGDVESWFDSTMNGHSDTGWQFNMKLLPNPHAKAKLRITQRGDFGKKLKGIRVFADYLLPLEIAGGSEPLWRGYRVSAGRLTCLAETMIDGRSVMIEQDLSADDRGWRVVYRVKGASATMRMDKAIPGAKRTGGTVDAGGNVILASGEALTLEVAR